MQDSVIAKYMSTVHTYTLTGSVAIFKANMAQPVAPYFCSYTKLYNNYYHYNHFMAPGLCPRLPG